MDGYAIRSSATATASPETPALLRERGTIGAGDDPADILDAGLAGGVGTCVEIMMGAIFPPGYDACVRGEGTVLPAKE